MYFLKKERLAELFAALSADSALYLPAKDKNGKTNYTKYTDGVEYSDALNTERSAKDFFFPQTEDLVDFKVEGKTIEVIDIRKPSEDYVIFGVRACDMASFDILDSVYLSEPVDSFYAERRSHATIMTMQCAAPSETCFCRTFGINPAAPAGDVACAITDSGLYLDPRTEKGTALVEKIASLLEENEGAEAVEQGKKCHEILDKLPLAKLSADSFGGERMMEHFRDEKWASLSEACLGCGTCTFVCPTCQCYDIKDFDTGHGVKRYRCWDSCMYSDFTKMAHGNSRNSQLERFRQRFMHKLVYYPANNDGKFGCVGCGRCLSKCPISMNIVKVMKALED